MPTETFDLATYNPNHDGLLDGIEAAVKADAGLAAKYLYAGGNAGTLILHFSTALSSGEKTTLETKVTDWGLDDTKRRLFGLIDAKAAADIVNGQGFEYPAASGQWISLSAFAQIKWLKLYTGRTDLVYPLKIRTKDDKIQISLADATAVQDAFNISVVATRAILDGAEAAKENVQQAANITAAQAAADAYL